VNIFIEQEPGSGGKESADATIRRLAGCVVHADRPTGDMTRAEPFAAQASILEGSRFEAGRKSRVKCVTMVLSASVSIIQLRGTAGTVDLNSLFLRKPV
jgi:phage terminase large subunit-like protein